MKFMSNTPVLGKNISNNVKNGVTTSKRFHSLSLSNENFQFCKISGEKMPDLQKSQAPNDSGVEKKNIGISSLSYLENLPKGIYVCSTSTATMTTSVLTSTVTSAPNFTSLSHGTSYKMPNPYDKQGAGYPFLYTHPYSFGVSKPFSNYPPNASQYPDVDNDERVISGNISENKYKECKNGYVDVTSPMPISSCNQYCQTEISPHLQSSADVHGTPLSPNLTPASFSLPPISIDKFDGNISDFKEFQIKMKSLFEMSHFPEKLKVIYLKSYLTGDPLESVTGIMPDDLGAYEEIWEVLNEDYGMPDLVKDHHLNLLLSINSWEPCKSNKDLRKLYRHINTHYRVLRHYGPEALEEAEAVKIFIIPLLTGYAGYKVTKLRQLEKTYNIPEILKILKSIINHEKFIESSKSITKKLHHDEIHLKEKDVSSKKQCIDSENITSNCTNFSCLICNTNSHTLYECNLYQTRDAYWNHILRHRLCANCLKPNHRWKECFKEKSCKLGCLRIDKHAPVLCRKFYL